MRTLSPALAVLVALALVALAAFFLMVLVSMNAKLGALDRMTVTLDHMDRGLAETNHQLVLANHALTITDQRLDTSLRAAQEGNQKLALTNGELRKTQAGIADMRVTLHDLDTQIAQLTHSIQKSHLLRI